MLKDRIISTYDLQALSPDESPLLYVPQTWTGTIGSIMDHTDVPLNSRLWAVLQFFDRPNWRKFILNCLVRIVRQRGLENEPFFVQARAIYQDCRSGLRPWSDAKTFIEPWIMHYYYLYCLDTTNLNNRVLARATTALKWAFTDEPFLFRQNFWWSVKDMKVVASTALIVQEMVAVLDQHP